MSVRESFLKLCGTAALLMALPTAAAEPARAEVDRRDAPSLLWIIGHNELNLESGGPDGASQMRKKLEAAFPGWKLDTMHLGSTALVPRNAVLILAGPKRDFSEDDAAKLRDLLANGFRLLVCLDPGIEHDRVDLARLRLVLQDAGANVGTDRIVDQEAALPGKPSPMPRTGPVREERAVFAARFAPTGHPILAALPPGVGVVFENACRVAARSSGSDPFDVRELATTSSSAYAISASGGRGPAGPVLVAATRRAGPGRYVVAGDSTFLTNGFAARTGIEDAALAIAALRWLAEGIEAPAPARRPRAEAANVADEDRQPIVLIIAIAVAALLVAGNAVLGKRS
ncbi:MAG: DUF4350 domain-containing protein [Planctomycetota bacterium]